MKVYSAHGINEFIVALGYKAEVVKDYFLNFYALNCDISIDLATGTTAFHNGKQPNWKVHLVDTGLNAQTGGRVKRLQKWLGDDETFMLTYGDGVGDINLTALLDFHRSHGQIATMTAVRSPARFGRIAFAGDHVKEFYEKPENTEGWINGGYFVLNRKALNYIEGDQTVWERDPVERLSRDGQLVGYRHDGFWSCMDTLKEKHFLEDLWAGGKAPWKIWQDEHSVGCEVPVSNGGASERIGSSLETLERQL
jgi:glucose-1-phosphate cytidylyltransferase